MLNIILADYAQTQDLDVIRLTTTLNIGPQATIPYFYPLPTNYLRMYDIFYNVNGTTYEVKQMPLGELDLAYTAQGINNYPEWWSTDMAQAPEATAVTSPSIAFFPPPAVPLTLTCRYRPQTSDIVTPETSATVPWFPNQRVLLFDLCMMAGMIADDARVGDWSKFVEKAMSKYLQMDDDKEGFSEQVKLDPRAFRNPGRLPPSKVLGF